MARLAKTRSPVLPRKLDTDADIANGTRAICKACPDLARIHRQIGNPPLRRWSPGFDGLTRIIVGQQLSTASAAAILARLMTAVDPLTPQTLLATETAALRAAGLSAGKIATLRALATALMDDTIDLATLAHLPEAELRRCLTSVRGIGPWTVDIYLLFGRGDADAFASGDLALQIAAQSVLGLDARPSAAHLEQIAERWRPWRAIAALMLWAHYADRRNQPAS
jgi:DNA-3-methyladenine glycosylase II